ncbi:MAG: bifunctional [glutamine synthetase] adenylyltransferase/[glutamine synthetase]-adenylyl-L-tyrosine phosphorylase [Alphaproteobacteria bacterium]|nr:bifunctional [glutamine synthetase] adenylyltransferase/[glutamine synthetase]-adenylyl-L-tyrosine phosphorylase [Alphaproteobacteria bacterium]
MRQSPLLSNPEGWPRPANDDRAALGRERWLERAKRETDEGLEAFAVEFAETPAGRTVLDAVFGNSPYLGDALLKEMGFFRDLLASDPKIMAETVRKCLMAKAGADEASLKRLLRKAKRQSALLIALADMAGLWTVEEVMGALSDFADTSLSVAVDHLLARAAEEEILTPPDSAKPARGSGFIVLAMGKLGAHELNYSSDVDLIVLYDNECTSYRGDQDIQRFFERLTRGLIALLEDRTADGYAFRTDLRLRPDPGAMPVALSVAAAETYYESTGQNWERAALIKARPVAGDMAAGEAFLEILRPFLWRKSLDFAAIEDIHSIKRQIEFHRGGHTIAVAGHNVKLGRGGIREIELFTQTQQLIWGGRTPELRQRKTCDTLRVLAAEGHVRQEVADELIESYRYLRRVEHRLQMVDDRQTHTLPKDADALGAFAIFLGYDGLAAFEAEISSHLGRVVRHSSELFGESPGLGAEEGKLVFTGGEDDPDTLETLEKMGFRDASNVAAVVRGWHHGRYRATRAERVRQILTELMPALLRAFTKTINPNAAFMKFDDFLSKLPAGVQLFSLFQANPPLLDLVAEIMGSTPRLADNLSRNPILLDAVLTADFFDPPPPKDIMAGELAEALRQARDFQDVLDIARRWANDWKFRIGVQVLRNLLPSDVAGGPLSDVAETVVTTMFAEVKKDFQARHGKFPDGGMAIVAMGKLGGHELTFQSDLDLVFVYDVPEGVEKSNGTRPLSPSHYFARLSQALTSALTSLTAEGKLYDIDTRLRPSGDAGPIATSLAAYREYFRAAAWTWERQALTRARTLAGPANLREATEAAITEALAHPLPLATLVRDVAQMRARVAAQRPGKHFWDIKDRPGGLIDVEFLCQYLALANLSAHPEIRNTNVQATLKAIRTGGLLTPEEGDILIAAAALWHRVLGLLRLSFEGPVEESDIPEGLRQALIRATESENFEDLKARIATMAENVARIFENRITTPAEEASDGT